LERTVASIPIKRPRPTRKRPQRLCLDKGYDYLSVRDQVAKLGFEPHIRSRGEEVKRKKRNPSWRARRWVVERTGSWHNRNRGLLIRWCKKPENHLALMQLASGIIAWRQAAYEGLPG
jgi:putative transposase